MAHAYTLSSFLSRASTGGNATYGGRSLEGRLRLPTEVVLAVRAAVGPDYPIGVRFDGEECVKGGTGWPRVATSHCAWHRPAAYRRASPPAASSRTSVKKDGVPFDPYTGYSGDRTMPAAQYQDGNEPLPVGGHQALRQRPRGRRTGYHHRQDPHAGPGRGHPGRRARRTWWASRGRCWPTRTGRRRPRRARTTTSCAACTATCARRWTRTSARCAGRHRPARRLRLRDIPGGE